jgi:hypothetical protein
MKSPIIFLVAIFPLVISCSTTKYSAESNNMEIVEAVYDQWSKPPPASSDIPERGIDLTITVQNWPQSYDPAYLVYDNFQSYSASIADSSNNSVTITARIIRTSSVMVETSPQVDQSDRLVFENADGAKGYIEILNWQPSR